MKLNLWENRRWHVAQQIEKYRISSMADFGCGEGKLITYLIQYFKFNSDVKLHYVLGVDINKQECIGFSDQIKKLVTENRREYLKLTEFSEKRAKFYSNNLNYPDVIIYNEDILNKNRQLKELFLKNKIVLITSIEVIEHLYLEQIDQYFDSLLGFYNTKYILITTPNIEYNIHYNLQNNQLRHHDHKFEFSREEFNYLCHKKALQYNYDLIIGGIGDIDENVGYPTQTAFFINKFNFCDISKILDTENIYNIVYEISINKNVKEKESQKTRMIKLISYITSIILKSNNELTINDIFNFYKVKRIFKKFDNFNDFLSLRNVKNLFRHYGLAYNFEENAIYFKY